MVKQLQCKSFQKYVKSHGIKKHVCTECNKDFSRKRNLQRHVKTHQERPIFDQFHICDICVKMYRHKSLLDRHFKSHRNDFDQCNQCSKCFLRTDTLRHKKHHEIESQCHTCSKCFKVFTRPDSLFDHTKVKRETVTTYRETGANKTRQETGLTNAPFATNILK